MAPAPLAVIFCWTCSLWFDIHRRLKTWDEFLQGPIPNRPKKIKGKRLPETEEHENQHDVVGQGQTKAKISNRKKTESPKPGVCIEMEKKRVAKT